MEGRVYSALAARLGGMSAGRTVLAFDFGSPSASVAVARGVDLLAGVRAPRAADAELLQLVTAALARAGVARGELDAVVALRGPGSFTGTRVACATALGLGAGLGVPAGGVSTLAAAALAAPAGAGHVVAVVDALRGEWFTQRFHRGERLELRPTSEPAIVRPDELAGGPALIVGVEARRFAAAISGAPLPALEVEGLAEGVARAVAEGCWLLDEEQLARPSYLRAAATSRPA
jgi:tRNA threonylcarbamoyladenosine biosynthesis protein TsaB